MTLTAPPAEPGSIPRGSRVEAVTLAGAILAEAFDDVRFGHLDDAEAVAVMTALEELGRKVDGAQYQLTAHAPPPTSVCAPKPTSATGRWPTRTDAATGSNSSPNSPESPAAKPNVASSAGSTTTPSTPADGQSA
ncbi:hypothetical protein [Cryobacterium sp. PH31-L1]|uniref:hypothetical protein n=1 Tax=Cryobacterium sp. PH31-L1 TaxID=3046199 RepID=UPI0024B9969F|nr:hypothetical protein [Cryobacterium sp. PH31-L1]MDJ0376647.1 hypothetical protein [Cryobacterium sp. PH31-L1]